jgi:hypothetical protein
MDPTALIAEYQALREDMFRFERQLTELVRHVGTAPAETLPRLADCLAEADSLHEREDSIFRRAGGAPPDIVAASRDRWIGWKVSIHAFRRAGLKLLGLTDDLRDEIAAERAVIADHPDHFAHAALWDEEAQLETDPAKQEFLFDKAFDAYVGQSSWMPASQNRVTAAGFASLRGDIARFCACYDRAIAIARQTGQKRGEISYRVLRMRHQLCGDPLGVGIDEIRAELDYTSSLRGQLPGRMEADFAEAFSVVEQAEAAPQPALASALASLARETEAYVMMVETGRLANCAERAATTPDDATLRDDATTTVAAARAGLETLRSETRVRLLLLAAEAKGALGDFDTPVEAILPKAELLAEGMPESMLAVHLAWSDAWVGLGDTTRAIAAARRAVAIALQVASVETRARAHGRLDALLSASGPVEPRPGGVGDESYVVAGLERASRALSASRPRDAAAICEALLTPPPPAHLLPTVRMVRATAHFEAGDLPVALQGFSEARSEMLVNPAPEALEQGNRLIMTESLAIMRAVVLASLDRPREAWEALEAGRAPLSRARLGVEVPRWAAMRAWLAQEKAAVLSLVPTHWGTLALSAGPDDDEPETVLLRGFGGGDIVRLLRPDLGASSIEWTRWIFAAAAPLSRVLIAPIAERLQAICAAASVLYIAPSDQLFHAPFAALEVRSGLLLDDLAPVAVVPSLWSAMLPHATENRATGSRAPTAPPVGVAVAAGRDLTGAAFAPHLDRVTVAPWPVAPARLVDDAATAAAVAAAGVTANVLHVSCHGFVDDTVRDVASASRLVFGGGTMLTARDMAGWPRVPALTFLNACQAGRFRAPGRTEPGGFPAAVLARGNGALIAPLTHVDPDAAGAVAEAFFRAWIGGETAALALRTARRSVRARRLGPEYWASHTCFGRDRKFAC